MSENMSRLDKSIWTSADGRWHTSIPTTVPEKWTPAMQGSATLGTDFLVYVSGEYLIRRYPYGKSAHTYVLYRNRVAIGLGTGRLKDAKEHAVRNARGEDVVNVA